MRRYVRWSVDREVRRVDVDDHPAFHVGAYAGEVPAAAHRPPYSRVLASRRTPHVSSRGLKAAPSGTVGIRAKHPECGDDAQRQARRGECTRWKRRREWYRLSVSLITRLYSDRNLWNTKWPEIDVYVRPRNGKKRIRWQLEILMI